MAQELVQVQQNGEPDWTTLGNILTASILGEVLCGSYVDFKYGRMSSDFRVDTEWSGLCPHTYPDEVCRGNYSDHSYSLPLLYDLYSDPGEIYTLDNEQYSDVITQIEKVKSQFEAGMVWGESQMGRGTDRSVEPCAKPGCSPFPSCCTTDNAFEQQLFPPLTGAV